MSTAANYSAFMHCVPIKKHSELHSRLNFNVTSTEPASKSGRGESLTAAEKDKARGNILKEYFQRLINGGGDSKNATNEKSNEKNKIKCPPIFNFQSRKKFFLFCISSLPVLNGFN